MSIYREGLDLSYHNQVNNFQEVKDAGISFVILRQSYRSTIDPKYDDYLKGFQEVGISIPAIYHFMYPLNHDDAVVEANFTVCQAIRSGLKESETIIFADFEYDTVESAKKKGVILGPEECREYTKAFCDTVELLGWRTGVYTNKDYYKNWYGAEFLKDRIVWLADYSGSADYPCAMHQYTSTGKINGISGNVDRNWMIDPSIFKIGEKVEEDKSVRSRATFVDQAASWLGLNESDGSYKKIIDVYNTLAKPYPRAVRMEYEWAWCACFWSAVALILGYQDIIPIEISCNELIKKAQEMGIWVEDDAYVPLPGDGILYDWQDNGVGDNKGWPDHIGIVQYQYVDKSNNLISTIEGNVNGSVQTRILKVNDRCIRGFITPRFSDLGDVSAPEKPEDDPEVESPLWEASEICGTYITTADLHFRKGPGTDKEVLLVLKKGSKVYAGGGFGIVGLTVWPRVIYGSKVGYCSGKFLEKE